ncbi:hypothetical protein ES692_06150 [Psychroserpens burtonensis]|uniref:Uncharacterized protein n=1 Tax=Psychroserpens burtonensis TaxID=49278 RepID=A0A5C7BBR6_9FLAO|nr:hypothetical protein [Psychroserpens burtonensis]TXE18623.1 hypothetical protein ES692_06150 [Psychroserpens burtonensis]
MAIEALKNELLDSDYLMIEELAEQNKGPRDIAKALRVSVRDFMYLWRNKTSRIREAYDLGRLQIEITKGEQLITMIEAANTTAIQIHDKNALTRTFEDHKSDVFGL